MKSYYRIMLGKKSAFAVECFAGGFIGADFQMDEDLSRNLPDEWRAFNKNIYRSASLATPASRG
jgi:restriction system protein